MEIAHGKVSTLLETGIHDQSDGKGDCWPYNSDDNRYKYY